MIHAVRKQEQWNNLPTEEKFAKASPVSDFENHTSGLEEYDDTAPMGGAKGDKGAKMNFPYDEIKSLVWDYEARAADIPRLEEMLQKATENAIGIQKEIDVCHAELRRVDARMAEIFQRAAQATTASESQREKR